MLGISSEKLHCAWWMGWLYSYWFFMLVNLVNCAMAVFFFFINGNLWSLASLTYLINKFLLFSCSCTRCCSLHQCDTNEVSFTYSRSAWLTPWHLLFPFIVCSLAVSVAFVVCAVRHRLKRVSFMVSHIEMKKRRKKMIRHLRSRWPALFMFCALGCKDVVCHCVCTESSIFSKTE